MKLNFEDFFITPEDYEFFQKLSQEEKIMFLYDLLCEQSYGTGSADDEDVFEDVILDDDDVALIDPSKIDSNGLINDLDIIAEQFEKLMSDKVSKSFDFNNEVSVIVLNNFVVFNSNDINLISKELRILQEDGYIIKKHVTTPKVQRIFQKQKICLIYELLGQIPPFSKN